MSGSSRRVIQSAVLAVTVASSSSSASSQTPSFRVLQWNVSDSAWVKSEAATRAVLRHASPDIVMLVEVHKAMTAADVKHMLSGMRGPADTVWYIDYRAAGTGGEHTAIASRSPLEDVAELDSITLPTAGSVGALIAQPDSERARAPVPNAVSIAGAVTRVGSRKLLVVPMHFTCCGLGGSWREYRRQADAKLISGRIHSVLRRRSVEGVIAGGDMNLVSGRIALDTILSSVPNPPLGPMRRADALHADGWTDWTWDGRGTAFNGGRLDNMTYSSGTLRVKSALIWDTEDMPADSLRAHGLETGTSQSINRHRPIVVDFTFVR